MFRTWLIMVLTTPLLISCHSNQPKTLAQRTTSQAVKNQGIAKTPLKQLFAEYYLELFEYEPVSGTFQGRPEYNDRFEPPITTENRSKKLAFEKKYLKRINAIERSKLSPQDRLSYKIFKRDRELNIQSYQFPQDLIPINQMSGRHNFYAQLGSGQSAQPFNNLQDYQNFIKRSRHFAKWMDSVIESMREGVKQGVVLPKVIVKKLIPQLKSHWVSNVEQSVFYAPLKDLPKELNQQSREQLIEEYQQSIEQVLIPAYRRVYRFLTDEYMSHARDSIGLSAMPNGKAWYEFLIKAHTTLPLKAKEIHAYGLTEVARILSEMKKVKQQVKFNGDLAAFFEFLRNDKQFYFDRPAQLLKAYKTTKILIDANLPKLFKVFPKADYIIKPVPDFQAASSAGAFYQPSSPDGSRPGTFFINIYNLKSQPKFIMQTLSIHEASPGHHFQIAIQQEIKGFPDFRKFNGYTVFSEGWALYAESLGKDLGLFTDPYMWYGRLVDEQLRAMRLVVDTGIHAFGWSRKQAIDYMLANSSMARSDVEAEVERYIVMPAQALAYKIGEREIRQLRKKAERLLQDDFDIKEFHNQVLLGGSLPIPVLREKINGWIETEKTALSNSKSP